MRNMFSGKAKERLRHYVYLYIDPRDDKVFYVGKGKGKPLLRPRSARRQADEEAAR